MSVSPENHLQRSHPDRPSRLPGRQWKRSQPVLLYPLLNCSRSARKVPARTPPQIQLFFFSYFNPFSFVVSFLIYCNLRLLYHRLFVPVNSFTYFSHSVPRFFRFAWFSPLDMWEYGLSRKLVRLIASSPYFPRILSIAASSFLCFSFSSSPNRES